MILGVNMYSFLDWLDKRESFVISPSIVDDEGDGQEQVARNLFTRKNPGAMPVYDTREMPPTKKTGFKSKKK